MIADIQDAKKQYAKEPSDKIVTLQRVEELIKEQEALEASSGMQTQLNLTAEVNQG